MFPSASGFITGCNFERMTEQYKKVDRRILIGKNTFTLRDLGVIYTENTPGLLIESYLLYLNHQMNFKDDHKLNESQIKNLGRQLLTILGDITMGELWLFFDQVFTGHFDQFYGNVEPMKIPIWARQYMSKRGDIIQKDFELSRHIRDRNWNRDNQKHKAFNDRQYEKALEQKNMFDLLVGKRPP